MWGEDKLRTPWFRRARLMQFILLWAPIVVVIVVNLGMWLGTIFFCFHVERLLILFDGAIVESLRRY